MDKYDVIIIGAGIGGLTTGNILAKNGMKVLILEKNHTPGGGVSTFYRNGYPIDITHCACGFGRNAFLGKILEYLNIYDELEFMELEKAFIYFSNYTNRPVFCYTDINKYTNELKSLFPNEAKGIDNLFNSMKNIWDKEILRSYYAPSFYNMLIYPFWFSNLIKYQNYTFEQFLNRFIKDSGLKEIVSVAWPYLGLDRFSVSALYMICTIMGFQV